MRVCHQYHVTVIVMSSKFGLAIKNVQLRIRMGQAWEMGASNCVADGDSSRLSIQQSENDRRRGVNYVNKVLQQKYGPNYTYR